MKKHILLFSLPLLGIASAVVAWSPVDDCSHPPCHTVNQETSHGAFGISIFDRFDRAVSFPLTIETRYLSTIKVDQIQAATSLQDVLGQDYFPSGLEFVSTQLTVLDDDYTELRAVQWEGLGMDEEQRVFLRSIEHSDNIMFRIEYLDLGQLPSPRREKFTPHISVVPHLQARYQDGIPALVDLIRMVSAEETSSVSAAELDPGKIFFNVTELGTIEDVRIVFSSGNEAIDGAMVEHLNASSGKWYAAENADGEPVSQELVLAFGSLGC